MQPTRIDFSGMDAFWSIYETLRQDHDPCPGQWEALLATPGYAALTASEFPRDFFPKKFRLAYMPSLAAEREQALAVDKFGFLGHYLEVQEREQELRRRQEWLAGDCPWMTQAENLAKGMLPPLPRAEAPRVSYLIFHKDARAYDPIVMDLLATIELADFLPLFMAHEFHHHFRKEVLQVAWDGVPQEYRDLARVLEQIHAEGLADQLDKPTLLAANHPFVRGYQEAVTKAPEYLALLRERLEQVSTGAVRVELAGRELNHGLPMSGHPIGCYIFDQLSKNYGRDEIIATAPNPFAWYRLWLKAANWDNPGLLSVLERLEKLAARTD